MFVGIDVAQTALEVALRPSAAGWVVVHDEAGIATLVARLEALQPVLIVLEATGGLEVLVTSALAAGGLPVVVVNPRQARDVAKATGPLAKTDALDARALAHFAEAVRPALRPLPDAQTRALSARLNPPTPVGGDAHGREEPPGPGPRSSPGGHSSPYHLVGAACGRSRYRHRQGHPRESALAGA